MGGSGCIAVAYSVGRDSSALLHATLRAARPLGLRVVALHVHHGLNPDAEAWLAQGQAQCVAYARAGWPVDFVATRLRGRPRRGDSVEAWAREQRYAALAAVARQRGASAVLLAHHRRDQAETVLLQALRGAGVAGLSGMARERRFGGVTWLRPWLDRSREAIEAYVRRHGIEFVDDDSNLDEGFARNRLRLRVWPALLEAFPQAEASLADAAAWAQQADECLAELAAIDLAQAAVGETLEIAAWQTLSSARRSNVLRAWLNAQSGRLAPASLVTRLLHELGRSASARWPAGEGELRCHRGRLRFVAPLSDKAAAAPARESTLSITRAGVRALPGWGGRLRVTRAASGGVPLAWLAQVELRSREGGEQFQAGIGRPARSLKKQYQAAGVPAWLRDGPLLYSGGQLVFVPGLGLDARAIGLPGQALVTLAWQPG